MLTQVVGSYGNGETLLEAHSESERSTAHTYLLTMGGAEGLTRLALQHCNTSIDEKIREALSLTEIRHLVLWRLGAPHGIEVAFSLVSRSLSSQV